METVGLHDSWVEMDRVGAFCDRAGLVRDVLGALPVSMGGPIVDRQIFRVH